MSPIEHAVGRGIVLCFTFSVAQKHLRLARNQPGSFYVDESCIDCETCRQIAPGTFAEAPELGKSFVYAQPENDGARLLAQMALVSCPTASIGSEDRQGAKQAALAFPQLVDQNVYYCGFASADSFGASSYFIQRDAGNVLVDSPRAAAPLMNRFAERGGVAWMFLSHRDDVADHEKFHRRFGCNRTLHAADVTPETGALEWIWSGNDPVTLAPDLLLIPLPGHTRGSAALLYRDRYLFTGDHLWGSEDGKRLGASSAVCWYSWAEQIASMRRLLDYSFEWVLPGHGRRLHAASAGAMRVKLERLLQKMETGR
jgi:glyoxylase-like metal-dependent hydrolase (beta-lactamase superfamily II)/ferredoxin